MTGEYKCQAKDCLQDAQYVSVPLQLFFCELHTDKAAQMGIKSFERLA